MKTYPNALLGYRAWNWNAIPPALSSVGRGDTTWVRGVNKAECRSRCGKEVPAGDCECGLYAHHSLTHMIHRHPDHAFGAVMARGRVEIHATGWRAEEAVVIALLVPRHITRDEKREFYKLADHYGVPIFKTKRALKKYAHRYASPAPDNLRPRDTTPSTPYIPHVMRVEGVIGALIVGGFTTGVLLSGIPTPISALAVGMITGALCAWLFARKRYITLTMRIYTGLAFVSLVLGMGWGVLTGVSF